MDGLNQSPDLSCADAEPGKATIEPTQSEREQISPKRHGKRFPAMLIAGAVIVAAFAWAMGGAPKDLSQLSLWASKSVAANAKPEKPAKPDSGYKPTDAEWASLSTEVVQKIPFRTTLVTDGKIAINEDQTTPVYSPYIGRIVKLYAKPGDKVEKGKPLFSVEASDMVLGQNDFLAAKATLNKAKSQLAVAEIVLKRHRELMVGNAVAKRDMEQAEIGHVTAVNDLKTAEVALEAARNRLRILGKTDAEITAFETGQQPISPETIILAPISGTIVQRKVGPGQLVNGTSNDPVFVIGDLSTVWLVANVRETDATRIQTDQQIEFAILATPDRRFTSTVEYISSIVNPDTHRLQVRGTVTNLDGALRPEMFANVTLVTTGEKLAPAVPRQAVIYEGEEARVWIVRSDRSIELRKFTPGNVSGSFVEVTSGIAAGEKIVARGSLFIDRLAAPAVLAND